MPRELLQEARYDFRGGLNTSASPFNLRANELSQMKNAVLDFEHGGVTKRGGARKLNQTILTGGFNVLGVRQWFDEDAGQNSVVIVHNGNLWVKDGDPVGNYTSFPSTMSTTEPPIFGVARTSTASAAAIMYIASNGFFKWTGSAITSIGGVGNLPTNIDMWAPYHTRAFWRSTDRLSALVWSALGNVESATVGGAEGGGEALFGYTRGDEIKRFVTQGGSLLVASKEAIGRFTGYSDVDIQIEQDSEGVSYEVGTLGLRTFEAVEDFAVTIDSRGVYAVTEGGVQPIGLSVERSFAGLDRDVLKDAIIGYDKGTRTIIFAVPGASDGGKNRTIYGLTLGAINAWVGPWTVPWDIHSVASVEDVNGDEQLVVGCQGGFARILDDRTQTTDDGTAIVMEVQPAPFFFERPGILKSVKGIKLDADVPFGAELEIWYRFDEKPWETAYITGTGAEHYYKDLHGQGYRLDVKFISRDAGQPRIRGFVMEAWDTGRDG